VLAGLADVAIVGAVPWLWRRRAGGSAGAARTWSASLVGPLGELVREQFGSPGQRLLGLRTVDRRTGEPVELWRTVAVHGVSAAGQLLARRLTPFQTPEGERFVEELRATSERNPRGSPERAAELSALMERHQAPIAANLWRRVAMLLALAIVNGLLRRRLAPTTEVPVRRRRRAHRP
jgi:hypothetical protein